MRAAELPPYVLLTVEKGIPLDDGELLPLPPGISASDLPSELPPADLERVLFAYRIPYLPDALLSQSLVERGGGDRLKEALDRQVRLISQFGAWQGAGFALRYIANPSRGSIDLALVARVLSLPGQSQRQVERVMADLTVTLRSHELPIEPVRSEAELQTILGPLSDPLILELRPHAEVRSLLGGTAFVVLPIPDPVTDWYAVLDTMLNLTAPCLISVLLQPTRLYRQERHSFDQAVFEAGRLAERTFRGMTGEHPIGDIRWRDVARLYTHHVEHLRAPFLVVTQIASDDAGSVQAVARALAAEVGSTSGDPVTSADGTRLPTGVEIVAPRTDSELAAARRTLSRLDIQPWGFDPGQWKERLQYLMDDRAASAVFRFPVDVGRGLPGIVSRQLAPSHESRARNLKEEPGEIMLGHDLATGAVVRVELDALTRHVLISGITGSGKTTTCMHLLGELWERGIPFLVIEPANSQYRTLLDSPPGADLQIFTLGDESVSPFRLNPLEILPGVRVESHISSLRACFEAALPTFGVLPSIIEESLYSVYLKRGWTLTQRGAGPDDTPYPTLSEFYIEVVRTVETRGYSEKTRQDILAAASGRIRSLLLGSKGRMLNTRRSASFESLMSRPTVLELDALNDEEKALVMLFLMTMLREYCRSRNLSMGMRHSRDEFSVAPPQVGWAWAAG